MTEEYTNILDTLCRPENIAIILQKAGFRDDWTFEGSEDVYRNFIAMKDKLATPIVKLENSIVGVNNFILSHDSIRIFVPTLFERNGTAVVNTSLDLQAVNANNAPNVNVYFPKQFPQSCHACRIVVVFIKPEIPSAYGLIRQLNELKTCFTSLQLGRGRLEWARFVVFSPDVEKRELFEVQDFVFVTQDDLIKDTSGEEWLG